MNEKLNIEIPSTIEEKLNRHSEQFGIPKEELVNELMEYIPTVKEAYPKLDLKGQVGEAYRQLTHRLAQEEGGIKSKAIVHTGFFIGETGIKDVSDSMKKKILRMPENERSTYHPDDNTWLDYREGETFMQPIESLNHRTLYGIGSSGREVADDRTKFMKVDLWRDVVKKISPEQGKLYTFRATPKDTDRQLPYYELSGTQFTRLRSSTTTLSDEDKVQMIRNSGKDVFTLDDLDTLYSTRFEGNFNVDPIFIEAYVSRIVVREEKSNMVVLYDDLETGMKFATAYIPHYLAINFKEEDRVIFLVELGQLEFEDETNTVAFVKGWQVVPNLANQFV